MQRQSHPTQPHPITQPLHHPTTPQEHHPRSSPAAPPPVQTKRTPTRHTQRQRDSRRHFGHAAARALVRALDRGAGAPDPRAGTLRAPTTSPRRLQGHCALWPAVSTGQTAPSSGWARRWTSGLLQRHKVAPPPPSPSREQRSDGGAAPSNRHASTAQATRKRPQNDARKGVDEIDRPALVDTCNTRRLKADKATGKESTLHGAGRAATDLFLDPERPSKGSEGDEEGARMKALSSEALPLRLKGNGVAQKAISASETGCKAFPNDDATVAEHRVYPACSQGLKHGPLRENPALGPLDGKGSENLGINIRRRSTDHGPKPRCKRRFFEWDSQQTSLRVWGRVLSKVFALPGAKRADAAQKPAPRSDLTAAVQRPQAVPSRYPRALGQTGPRPAMSTPEMGSERGKRTFARVLCRVCVCTTERYGTNGKPSG